MSNKEMFDKLCELNPELVQDMKNCHHAYKGKPNSYHLENDVFTHTKMVCDLLPENCSMELMLAGFFHDAGKVPTRKERHEKEKTSFFGHEFASLQYLVDFLVKQNFTTPHFKSMMLAVNNHLRYHNMTDAYKIAEMCNNDENAYKMLYEICKADEDGRTTTVPYSPKQYNWAGINKNYNIEECDVVFFGGSPGCGKDYLAGSDMFGTFDSIFSWDDIRVELYKLENPKGWKNYSEGDLYGNAWNWCNKKKIDLNSHLKKKVDAALYRNERVAICNTFCNMKNRAGVMNLIRNYPIGAVHVFCDMETMIERDKNRSSHNVGSGVIKRFAYEQVMPTCAEGFVACEYVINNENYKVTNTLKG